MKREQIMAACLMLSVQGLAAGNMADAVRNSGIKGGIVVHLGCGDGKATASLFLYSSYTVHGLDADRASIAKARKHLRSRNLYGRVSVAAYDGKTLPYGDNIVNLIVADSLGGVSREEAMRVLTPLGAMIISGEKTVKPWPHEIDDCTRRLQDCREHLIKERRQVEADKRDQEQHRRIRQRVHELGVEKALNLLEGED